MGQALALDLSEETATSDCAELSETRKLSGTFSIGTKSPMRSPTPSHSGPLAPKHKLLGMSVAQEAARMPKRIKKTPPRRIVLRLPDLDHAKSSVLNSLSSLRSRHNYKFAMEQFITCYCSEPRLALNRTVILRFRLYLESLGLAAGTINQRLAAVRRLVYEAADSGLLSPELKATMRFEEGYGHLRRWHSTPTRQFTSQLPRLGFQQRP